MRRITLTEKQIERMMDLEEYYGNYLEPVFGEPDSSCYGCDYYYFGKSYFAIPDVYNTGDGYVEFNPRNRRIVDILERIGIEI